MQHLDPERLAALNHHTLSAQDREHLTVCGPCQREAAAYHSLGVLAAAAANVPSDAPRLTTWDGIAAGLRQEGLLAPAPAATAAAPAGARRGRNPWFGTWLRSAAAIALVVGGTAVGRVSAGAPLLPQQLTTASAAGVPSGSTPENVAVSGDSGVGAVASNVSLTLPQASEFSSVAEASAVIERAQRDYERAAQWLAANDPAVHSQEVYRARLVALDEMVKASRAALYEAPQDPVLNQYYLAAYSAREATLRQLGSVLPVDRIMERF